MACLNPESAYDNNLDISNHRNRNGSQMSGYVETDKVSRGSFWRNIREEKVGEILATCPGFEEHWKEIVSVRNVIFILLGAIFLGLLLTELKSESS